MKYLLLSMVLTIASGLGHSAEMTYGDWKVKVYGDAQLTEAFTANSSGSIFGLLCLAANDVCSFYVFPQTTCEEGDASSILINSDAGALAAAIKCVKIGDTYYSFIQETSLVQDAVMKSKNIGIAIPMEGGQFKVVRFSLIGANSAILQAAQKAAEIAKTSDRML